MLNQPSWFSETQYYAEKFKELTANGDPMTYEEMVAAIEGVGGAWAHYEKFGYAESYVSSGATVYYPLQNGDGKAVFDPKVYCESKVAQLIAAGDPLASTLTTWEKVAAFITGTAKMSLYDHYVAYGQTEGLSVNGTFSTKAFFQSKLVYVQANLATHPAELATVTTWQGLAAWYAKNNIDSYQNWADYGAGEGITAEDVKPGSETPDPGPDPNPEGEPIVLYPIGWNTDSKGNLVYNYNNDVTGTDSNDLFQAYIRGDLNSLNTGDKIDGKGGIDTLEADITGIRSSTGATGTGGGYVSALTPQIKNVEVMKFRVQETGDDESGSNNPQARIDAERIEGVIGRNTEFWSWNSRDDLLIEDVRIKSNQVLVGMQNTDPGNVDYDFYFSSQYLFHEGEGSTTSTLKIKLIDTQGMFTDNAPFLNNIYDVIEFTFDNVAYELKIDLIRGATATYQDLLDAINEAIVTKGWDSFLKAELLGDTFPAIDTWGDGTFTGEYITLVGTGGAFDPAGGAWAKDNDEKMPSKFAIAADVAYDTTSGCPLIQTNVALDNVGRVQWDDAFPDCLPDDAIYGSRAGDLLIGSMGNRGGIERFDVQVDRGSWLNSLASTNNTLRYIAVTAADLDGDTVKGNVTSPGVNGQLFIGAQASDAAGTTALNETRINWQNKARLLTSGITNTATLPTSGIWDVKAFDAAAYTGNVNIAAVFTAEARDKYLADVDGLRTIYKDYAPGGEFQYSFGSGDDTLNMLVNGGIAADRDFVLQMEMGDGNDLVNFAFDFKTGNQAIDQAGLWRNWTSAREGDGWAVLDSATGKAIGNTSSGLKNVSINTGNGDDTVWAWGQAGLMNSGDAQSDWNIRDQRNQRYDGVFGYLKVDAGAGDDAVYTAQDSVARNAVWVLNANSLRGSNEDRLLIDYTAVGQAQPINNNVSSTAVYYAVQGTTLRGVVEFLGVAAEFTVEATAGQVSADAINKAIIKAVNESQLSKLIAVFDGAGQSLIVQSLIDGVYTVSSAATDADNSYGFNVRFDNISGDASDYVQQARVATTDNVGIANRVFEIDFVRGAGTGVGTGPAALNAPFAWGDVGKVYTITIGGTVIKYTQQLDDRVWLDIVEGLQADLVAKGLGDVYTIVENRVANVVQDDELSIVRNAKDYVGALTSTTTLTAGAAPGAGPHTVTVGATVISFTYTPPGGVSSWATFASALEDTLRTAKDNGWVTGDYDVTAIAGGVRIEGEGVGLNDVVAASGGLTGFTFYDGTGYNTVDPDINYSVADFTVPTTGTLTFTLDTGWTVTEGLRYTVHLDNVTAPAIGGPSIIATAEVTNSTTTWQDLVALLNADALGRDFTITSTSTGVLKITSKIDDANLGNTTHAVADVYDVTCNTEAFSKKFGIFGDLDDNTLTPVPGTVGGEANSTTLTWGTAGAGTPVTIPASGTYTFSFGGETITLTYNALGATDWTIFANQLQDAVSDAINNYTGGLAGEKLTVYNGTAIAGLDAPGRPATITGIPHTVGYYIINPITNGIVITGYGVPNAAITTTSRIADIPTASTPQMYDAPIKPDTTAAPFNYIGGFSNLQIDGWEFNPDGYDTYEIRLDNAVGGTLGLAGPVTLKYEQKSGDRDWEDIAKGLNQNLIDQARVGGVGSDADILDKAYSIDVGSEDGTLVVRGDVSQASVTPPGAGLFSGAVPGTTTEIIPTRISTNATVDIVYDPDEDTRILTITPDNFTNLATAGVREISIDAWDFTVGLQDSFTVTIDPDGDGPMKAFTLTYRQGDSGKAETTWDSIYEQLNSQIKSTPEGLAFLDQFDLLGYSETNPTTGDEIYGLRITGKTAVGLISNYGVDPTITITYTDANGDPIARDTANTVRFRDYEDTDINSTAAVGTDRHYYGLSEVYGGDGDDVIATGFADAIVHAGAGNDVIVVGNETYNFIYGEGGHNTIYLGVFSQVNQTTGDVDYNRTTTGLLWGNNGNNVGTANNQTTADAHDKVFVTDSGTNVIYNFDVDTTANARLALNIQSDRLYGITGGNFTMGTYDAATDTFVTGAGVDMQIDGGGVVLIGVGNVPGTLGLGGGKDEFGDYITVTVAN